MEFEFLLGQSRSCLRLAGTLVFKEVRFWEDEGQNLMILEQEKCANQPRYCSFKAVTEQNESSGKEHIHLIASNFYFSSHEDVLEGS